MPERAPPPETAALPPRILRGWGLRGRDLRGLDLRERDLSAVSLVNQDLTGCDLRGVTLDGRDLSASELSGARLDGASLRGALLCDCDLHGASLRQADLSDADLRRSEGFGVQASAAVLARAVLTGAEWREARLEGASLAGAQAGGARFDRSILIGADLREARMIGAVLDGAQLQGADLRRADLRRAALAGAAGIFLTEEADLRGADLRGVDPASLSGARLDPGAALPARARFDGLFDAGINRLRERWPIRAEQLRQLRAPGGQAGDTSRQSVGRTRALLQEFQSRQSESRQQAAARRAAEQRQEEEFRAQARARRLAREQAEAEARARTVERIQTALTSTAAEGVRRVRMSLPRFQEPEAADDVQIRLEIRQIASIQRDRRARRAQEQGEDQGQDQTQDQGRDQGIDQGRDQGRDPAGADRAADARLVPRESVPDVGYTDLFRATEQSDMEARLLLGQLLRDIQTFARPPAPLQDMEARFAGRLTALAPGADEAALPAPAAPALVAAPDPAPVAAPAPASVAAPAPALRVGAGGPVGAGQQGVESDMEARLAARRPIPATAPDRAPPVAPDMEARLANRARLPEPQNAGTPEAGAPSLPAARPPGAALPDEALPDLIRDLRADDRPDMEARLRARTARPDIAPEPAAAAPDLQARLSARLAGLPAPAPAPAPPAPAPPARPAGALSAAMARLSAATAASARVDLRQSDSVPDLHDVEAEERPRLLIRQGLWQARAEILRQQQEERREARRREIDARLDALRQQEEAEQAERQQRVHARRVAWAFRDPPAPDPRLAFRQQAEHARRLALAPPALADERRAALRLQNEAERAQRLSAIRRQRRREQAAVWLREARRALAISLRFLQGSAEGIAAREDREDFLQEARRRERAFSALTLPVEGDARLDRRRPRPAPAPAPALRPTPAPRPALPSRTVSELATILQAQLRALPSRVRARAPSLDLIRAPKPPEITAGADLQGQNLSDIDLHGRDLSGVRLARANLVGADLRGARLAGADLSGADLTDARLSGADLTGADLSGARLDQAALDGAILDGVRWAGAQVGGVRGLSRAQIQQLRASGAESDGGDDRQARIASYMSVGAIAAALLLYLLVQWREEGSLDPGSLEHAAGEAQRAGRTEEAAATFKELADRQDQPEAKTNYLLEAAASAADAADYDRALLLLEEALTVAGEGPMEPTVQLRLARTQARASLTEAAAARYRALLERIDLHPAQLAEALTGLSALLPEDQQAEIAPLQQALLDRAHTDLERAALALALADGWSARSRPARAIALISETLPGLSDTGERAALRLKLARLHVESGDNDGGLALYRELAATPGSVGSEARLGAVELLVQRGKTAEAADLLAPLLESQEEDLRARAMMAQATLASLGGDDAAAADLLRAVLTSPGLEPRRTDEARLLLGRILVRSDPEAAAALLALSPTLREEMLLSQARALREAGQRDEARERWAEVVEDPTIGDEARLEAHMSLADLQMEEGDVEGALSRFETLLSDTADAALRQRITLGMADALLRMGRLQEAETRYEGLIPVSRPEVAVRARLGLARAAALRGQNDRAARQYLDVAAEDGPWAIEALLALADLRERNGDLPGAAEALRLARTRDAAGVEAERRTAVDIALARILSEQGDPAAADIYATLLEAPDPEVRVQARLTVAAQQIDADPAAAAALYEAAADEAAGPDLRAEARAGWLRAMILADQAAPAMARIDTWLQAESDSPRRGLLALAAVKALRAEGRAAEAVAFGQTWLEDGGFELSMELATLLREQGDLAAAASTLQSTRPATPEDRLWHAETLLDILILSNRLQDADALCARLQSLPGGELPARMGRARLLREQGRSEEALALLSELDDPRVPMERAQLLLATDRSAEAAELFRRMLLAADPEQRSAGRVGLARILQEAGTPEQALALLDEAPVEGGYALTAAQIRGEALLSLDRVDDARRHYSAMSSSLSGDAETRTVGLLGLAACALARDNTSTARAYFEQALLYPDRFYQAHALAGLVRVASEAGDLTTASRLLDQLRADYADREDAIASATEAMGR